MLKLKGIEKKKYCVGNGKMKKIKTPSLWLNTRTGW